MLRTYCVHCMQRDPANPHIRSSIKHEVQIIPYNLRKNTSNLFADDSELITDCACENCNFHAGNFECERANNHNNIPRKFSTKISQSIILNVGDYALLDIARSVGDDERVNFSVTSEIIHFGSHKYVPLSQIEHRTLSHKVRHYVAFGPEDQGYALFDDAYTKVNNSYGVVDNKNICMLILSSKELTSNTILNPEQHSDVLRLRQPSSKFDISKQSIRSCIPLKYLNFSITDTRKF